MLNKYNKVLSVFLCVFMLISGLPTQAIATDVVENENDEATELNISSDAEEDDSNQSVFSLLMSTQTLSDFRSILLNENNKDAVLELTNEEIQELLKHVEEIYIPDVDSVDLKDELIETLHVLPNGEVETDIEVLDYVEWSGTQSGGSLTTDVVLVGDTYMTSTITISSGTTVTIDLNGYMLHGSGSGSVISNKGTLTIKDSRPNEGSHRFTTSSTGPWVLDDENGDFEVVGGIVTGGRDQTALSAGSSGGGAVKQGSNTTSNVLYIEGGTFIGNSSTRAGGAFYGGAVTMSGGMVIGNFAEGFGGGISLSGSFTMSGGVVRDNETSTTSSYNNPSSARFYDNADVIIGQKSSFIMTGGSLIGNLCTVTSTTGSPSFTMTGGTVEGNFRILNGLNAKLSGGSLNGSIYMKKGSCTVSDSALIFGGSRDNGGSVFIDGGNFTITGGTIRDSHATNGGAVYVNNGDFTMSGGLIDNCSADNAGGAVYLANGQANIDGGIIENCESNYGGAVYIDGGSFTMTDGTMQNNSAVDGGSVYVSGGSFEVHGGYLCNNTANNGGAAYISGGDINIYNGTFDSNSAVQNGGAIYLYTDSVDVTINVFDGKITNNVAENHGGAIGANAEGSFAISLNIGLESCKGLNCEMHEDGTCPEILNNTANRLGGAFCLHGEKDKLSVDIYCGAVTGNVAIRNSGSNSINQGGGAVTVWGGTIDPGIMIGGGSYTDNRLEAEQVTIRFWGNYDGAPTEPHVVEITAGLTVTFPLDTYARDGHFLTGWTTAPDATGLYVPANGQHTISTGNDGYLDFYAAWDIESSYVIYIPDTLPIDESQSGIMTISADVNYFTVSSNLNIYMNSDFCLACPLDAATVLQYQVFSSEFGTHHIINSGDVVATFQYNNKLSKTLTATILPNQDDVKRYGEIYSDTITFIVEYGEIEE